MDKKTLTLFLTAVLLTFVFTLLIKYYRPPTAGNVSFDDFPLQLGDWVGSKESIAPEIIDLLNPQEIISISYVNSQGTRVHLLFDFFSSEATFGGPHSPRNCLPGSGWVIKKTVENNISLGGRVIPAHRFQLQWNDSRSVMDFWYITHYGETANDYVFKIYELLSALTFKPRDIAFVRFVAKEDQESLQALQQFQELFVKEIYARLPFRR